MRRRACFIRSLLLAGTALIAPAAGETFAVVANAPAEALTSAEPGVNGAAMAESPTKPWRSLVRP